MYSRIRVFTLCSLTGLLLCAPAQGAGFLQVFERQAQDGAHVWVVQADGAPLSEVLDRIAEKSGIRFHISGPLQAEPVRIEVQGESWTDLVLTLFEERDAVYLWAGPSRLKQVYMVASPQERESFFPAVARTSPQKKEKRLQKTYYVPKARRLSDSALSESQLKRLLKGKPHEPIPEELFRDRAILKFLNTHGMKSLKDRNNRKLVLKVRRYARRHLKQLMDKNDR